MDIDFSQLSDMLGIMSEEELQNLQDTAQNLFASMGGEGFSSAGGEKEQAPPASGGFGGLTPEMLMKLTQVMQRMNARDPRTDLIMALKPHLSHRRQQRAEQAVQMMKMLTILPALREELAGKI